MSTERRTKRANARKATTETKKKLTIGSSTITLDKDKVTVETEYRKAVYKAAGYNPSYIAFSMIFEEQPEEERNNLARALIGLEALPVYCHSDAELAGKVMDVVLENFEKMMEQMPRGEDEDDIYADAEALINLEVQESL